MKQDIDTALKMLRARGGELDKKAADIIVDLFAEVVGKRVGVKLDEHAHQQEIAHLKAQLEEKDARIDKLMGRQQELLDVHSNSGDYLSVGSMLSAQIAVTEQLRRDLVTRNAALIDAKAKIAKLEEVKRSLNKVIDGLTRDQAGIIRQAPGSLPPIPSGGSDLTYRPEPPLSSGTCSYWVTAIGSTPPSFAMEESVYKAMVEASGGRVEQENVSHETLDDLRDGIKARHFDRLTGAKPYDV